MINFHTLTPNSSTIRGLPISTPDSSHSKITRSLRACFCLTILLTIITTATMRRITTTKRTMEKREDPIEIRIRSLLN